VSKGRARGARFVGFDRSKSRAFACDDCLIEIINGTGRKSLRVSDSLGSASEFQLDRLSLCLALAMPSICRSRILTNRKRRCPPMPNRYFYRPHVGPFGDRPPVRNTLTGGRPPGRKLPDLCWGGLLIIAGNGAKCRPGGFSGKAFFERKVPSDNILGLLKAKPKHERTRG
jgi:hypothetical protein